MALPHKVKEETKGWGDYKKLPEEMPEFHLIRRMLLGGDTFSQTMDPCFVGSNAAVMQYTQFEYTDESTRRQMTNAAAPKPGRFEDEWAKLNLAPMVVGGKADLQEAALIVMSVKPELAISGKLLTRTALAPFGCKKINIKHSEEKNKSAGRLVVPKYPDGKRSEEQGPSSLRRNKKRDDKEGEDRRSEEPM